MKSLKTIFGLIALLSFISNFSLCQTTASGTWALTVDSSVVVVGNVTAIPASGGTGIGAITYGSAGIVSTGWDSPARDTSDYYQFRVSPVSGNKFNISSTDFVYSTNGTATMTSAVYYSTNGGLNFTQIGSDISVSSTQTPWSDTTHITVNSGVTLILRIYGWAAVSSNNKFRVKSLVISGTTSTITAENNLGNSVPSSFRLYQNYPNPFNPETQIKFDMAKSSLVKLSVYDLLGQEIETLVNEKLNAGSYKTNWNASGYPSGVYFCRIQTEDYYKNIKMILLK